MMDEPTSYSESEIKEALLVNPEGFDELEAELERRRKVRDHKRENAPRSNYYNWPVSS
jgi:hypothetical protein